MGAAGVEGGSEARQVLGVQLVHGSRIFGQEGAAEAQAQRSHAQGEAVAGALPQHIGCQDSLAFPPAGARLAGSHSCCQPGQHRLPACALRLHHLRSHQKLGAVVCGFIHTQLPWEGQPDCLASLTARRLTDMPDEEVP